MAEQKTEYVWMDGEYVRWEDAKVHVTTHALHYGTGVFEGIRGYWNEKKKNVFLFRVADHVSRLFYSKPFCAVCAAALKSYLLKASRHFSTHWALSFGLGSGKRLSILPIFTAASRASPLLSGVVTRTPSFSPSGQRGMIATPFE